MPPKELTDQFYRAIFPLLNWEYDPATVDQNNLEVRGLVDKFIFQPLTEDQKQQIVRKAKGNRMSVPPPLNAIVEFDFIKDQIAHILKLTKEVKSFDELYSKFDYDSDYTINKFNKALAEVISAKKIS